MLKFRSLVASTLPVVLLVMICASPVAFAAEEGEKLLLNPNTASIDAMSKLPGMNAELAKAVALYRELMGDMNSVEDLLDVDGFTPELLEQLQPYISVDPMATDCGC